MFPNDRETNQPVFRRDGDDINFWKTKGEDKIQKRKKRSAEILREKRKKAREEALAASLAASNRRIYETYNFGQRIEFALNGYCFENNPGVPAIELCETTLNTTEGMGRGVRVGRGFDFLPENFIVLYSMTGTSITPADGIQRLYQVQLGKHRFMQIDTEPTEPYGLANFINAAVGRDEDLNVALRERTSQNMKVVQCELITSVGHMSLEHQRRFPAYVKVTRPIPRGDELLMLYGSLYRRG
jgi:hypothetical protein